MEKACTVCKQVKPLEDFYNRKASEDGKAYRCKVCDNAAVRRFRSERPERYGYNQRKANLLTKYGITLEDFNEMWEAQGGMCEICGVDMESMLKGGGAKNVSNTACVDHCHSTGVVRGLLCALCNKALGMFHDIPERLEKAATYLRKHSEIH